MDSEHFASSDVILKKISLQYEDTTIMIQTPPLYFQLTSIEIDDVNLSILISMRQILKSSWDNFFL